MCLCTKRLFKCCAFEMQQDLFAFKLLFDSVSVFAVERTCHLDSQTY